MAKKLNGEPRYQVPRELADSLAFRSLPNSAKRLWHDMMMQYRGYNNGNINAALGDLERYGWHSPTTLSTALKYLLAHGFIIETRMGGRRAGNLKQCCLYGFTHLPIHANKELGISGSQASFEYRHFDPRKNIVADSLTLQKLERVDTDNVACRSILCTREPSVATDFVVREIQINTSNALPVKGFH
jgi:hypothetical protein